MKTAKRLATDLERAIQNISNNTGNANYHFLNTVAKSLAKKNLYNLHKILYILNTADAISNLHIEEDL